MRQKQRESLFLLKQIPKMPRIRNRTRRKNFTDEIDISTSEEEKKWRDWKGEKNGGNRGLETDLRRRKKKGVKHESRWRQKRRERRVEDR